MHGKTITSFMVSDLLAERLKLSGLSNAGQFPFDMAYVWNSKLQSSNNPKLEITSLKIDNCQPASAVVMMTEKLANFQEYLDTGVQTWAYQPQHLQVYVNHPTSTGGMLIDKTGYWGNVGQPKADWTRFTTRHHGGGFLLFADGHVQWYGWAGVQAPESQFNPYNANTYDAKSVRGDCVERGGTGKLNQVIRSVFFPKSEQNIGWDASVRTDDL